MARKFAMTGRVSEQAIQRAVIAHLNTRAVPGLFWWHHPAGGRRSSIEAAIFVGLGCPKGMPDLLFLHQGQLLALELKAAGGIVSDDQMATMAALAAAGATVGVAWSLDEAIGQLESWGLLRGQAQVGKAA